MEEDGCCPIPPSNSATYCLVDMPVIDPKNAPQLDRVSLLQLLSDGVLKRIWEKYRGFSSVVSYQAPSFLCSDHVTEDLFRGEMGSHGDLRWREGRLYSQYLL